MRKAGANGAASTLVSVVIPTHNRAGLLSRAIQSVLDQTHRSLEILVVDDASTDDTPETIANIKDARIRYIRHPRSRGGGAARNTGIHNAGGEYVAFLDDDDEWEPQKLEEQLKILRRHPAAMCAYQGEQQSVARMYQMKATIDLPELKKGFFRGGSASALIVRTDLLRTVLFDETLPRFQDWDLCIRLAQQASIGYTPRPLVRYNDGNHARISNKARALSLSAVEGELRMMSKHKEFFGKRWYRFHVCRYLLQNFRHRSNKVGCIVYVCRNYGFVQFMRAAANLIYDRSVRKMLGWS